jgi:hypothetical protein
MKHFIRVAVLAATVAAWLSLATPAMAATAAGYEEFEDCPSKTVDSAITLCLNSVVDGGHLQLGSKDTPITDPITLSGAFKPVGGVGGTFIVGSFDGGHQEVPGGLTGITGLDWLANLVPGNLLEVFAHAELAGTPGSPLADPFTLPLKVKLENPLLSSTCYIGSDTNPITLNLTTGVTDPPPPNEPIVGVEGPLTPDGTLAGVFRSDSILVDNAFAAPAAQGCSLIGLGLLNGPVSALINLQAGLPSPAGTNEAVQEALVSFAGVTTVYPPLGFE